LVAKNMSLGPQGVWNAPPLYEQPPATCASLMGTDAVPTLVLTSSVKGGVPHA
jgi:hypothetical protein